MSRRLTALLATPALLAVLATGCADEAAAARVGDTTISNDDLMSEVETLAGDTQLLDGYGIPPDAVPGEADADNSYSQQFVGYLLSQRIFNVLAEDVLADRDAEVTDADREEAESQIDGALGPDVDIPDSFREDLIDQVAVSVRVTKEFGGDEQGQQDLQQAIFDKALETDIEVSSKYGSWDEDQLAVIAPDAPVGFGDDTGATQ